MPIRTEAKPSRNPASPLDSPDPAAPAGMLPSSLSEYGRDPRQAPVGPRRRSRRSDLWQLPTATTDSKTTRFAVERRQQAQPGRKANFNALFSGLRFPVRIDRLDSWLGRPEGGTSDCADDGALLSKQAQLLALQC